jgi:hypothetical protein
MNAIKEYLLANNNFSLEVFKAEVWSDDDDYYLDNDDCPSADYLGVMYIAQYAMPGYLDTHSTVIAETYDQAVEELDQFTEDYLLE